MRLRLAIVLVIAGLSGALFGGASALVLWVLLSGPYSYPPPEGAQLRLVLAVGLGTAAGGVSGTGLGFVAWALTA